MSFISKYTGEAIEEALSRANQIESVNNGWVRVTSTSAAPVSLNVLTNPGNYTISYWINGPEFPADFRGPLNIIVCQIGTVIYQIIYYLSECYMRTINGDTIGSWGRDNTNADVKFTPTEPTNPSNGTIWMDTTVAASPVMKVYLNGSWKECIPTDMMKKSVYDPRGLGEDIYAYVDDAIENANLNSIDVDFSGHISNFDIHVNATEKETFLNKASSTDVDNRVSALRTTLLASVDSKATSFQSQSNLLTTSVQSYMSTLNTHANNTTIHPTQEQIGIWDNKSDVNHTHLNNGTVTIDASNIVGNIPIERIDRSALERLETVDTEANRLTLTIDTVQNGDLVYCTESMTFYFVVDDTKLNNANPEITEEAFKRFATGAVVLSWDIITNKPETIAAFGITDAYTKSEVDARITDIETEVDDISETVTKYNALADVDVDSLVSLVQRVAGSSLDNVKEIGDRIVTEYETFDVNLDKLEKAVELLNSII